LLFSRNQTVEQLLNTPINNPTRMVEMNELDIGNRF